MPKEFEWKFSQRNLFGANHSGMLDGYYSDDKPNIALRDFIENHLRTKKDQESFSPQPYLKTIKASKADAVYNMHSYASKKPFDAVSQYVKNFSLPGELVLDPFCGSGGAIYCALKNGRKAIAVDLSPSATFITKGICTPFDPHDFLQNAELLVRELEEKYGHLYTTTCGYCLGNAEIRTIAWSMLFKCPKCLKVTPLAESDTPERGSSAKGQCSCGEPLRIKDKINIWQPVRIEYKCLGNCKSKAINKRTFNGPNKTEAELFLKDSERILKIEEELKKPDCIFPEFEFPERARVQVLRSRGIIKHSQVYSSRNREVATYLWSLINRSPDYLRDVLKFWFTSSILSLTLFERDRTGGGGYQSGTMYIPYNCKDRSPFYTLRSKMSHIKKGLTELLNLKNNTVFISTQDASNLDQIPSNSIDYVFTDPPYGDKVQFWELNCIWEAWLGFKRDWDNYEAVINHQRQLDEEHWKSVIQQCFSEIYRVLKPGRYLSLCFHGTDIHWMIVQDICCEIGFMPDRAKEAVAIDSLQKSFKQLKKHEDNVRRDLIINFKKPLPGEVKATIIITDKDNDVTHNEKVIKIIKEYLELNPGSTKDRIYDEVISRMVRAGQMEAHNFEELLNQVAEEVKQPIMKDLFTSEDPNLFGTHEIRHWYLKEDETATIDHAESVKEDEAAKIISEYIKNFLNENPHLSGAHYSDIFEYYVYSARDKPRRPLSDWIIDYFFKTESGTYRSPASEEEEHLKAEGRINGINRQIKRYIGILEHGGAIPQNIKVNNMTLSNWIRHCKRSGLFEQGRVLYEKGGLNLENLSEDSMVNIEEDYQICVRMLERESK